MTTSLTSRERLLRAMRHEPTDHVPCAFMSFTALRGRCQDAYELAELELAMGLDSWVMVPSAWRNLRPNHPDLRGLPVRLPRSVETRLWLERVPGETFPILHKEYHTPAGVLTTRVRKTDDWPHGNFVPFLDDYQIPRAVKPLVTSREDLEPLRTMLQVPSEQDVAAFRAELEQARAFSARHGVLVAGGWGVGADMVGWLCGLENMMLLAVDDPQLLEDLLAIIAGWNEARMRVVLEGGVDLYVRRGWYEGADFWSPALYRRFLLPHVRREVALAHEYGALFGYNMTTGALPMLDAILEVGVDVLIGVDPLQRGQRPLRTMRDRLGGRVCLWGGVNGAITVEQGTPEDVRRAVHEALDTMQGVNGFILSPVDNITDISLQTWQNVQVFIDAWKEHEEVRP
ncbi:MAG: uroporphyrinogen decarboxylase family protein [Anaerolineae bacterium]|nr:uroporphyrinogen decarboxylase family protein [Anaerolineae bacterium]